MVTDHTTIEYLFRDSGRGFTLARCSHKCFACSFPEQVLDMFGFTVPAGTTYILQENDMYSLKYRKHGACVTMHIKNSQV